MVSSTTDNGFGVLVFRLAVDVPFEPVRLALFLSVELDFLVAVFRFVVEARPAALFALVRLVDADFPVAVDLPRVDPLPDPLLPLAAIANSAINLASHGRGYWYSAYGK